MALPDFELGPLEMMEVAALEAAIAPATARVEVQGDPFLLRLAQGKDGKPRLFAILEQPDAPVVLAELKSGFSKNPSDEPILVELQKPDGGDLEELVQSLKWSRRLEVPVSSGQEEGALAVLVLGAAAEWRVYRHRQDAEPFGTGGFVWEATPRSQQWLLRAPKKEILSEVERWLREPESNCAFALRWAQLETNNRRMRLVLSFQHGGWDEFERVLGWISCNQNALWNRGHNAQWSISVTQSLSDFQKRGLERGVRNSNSSYSEYELKMDGQVVNIKQLFQRTSSCLDVLHLHFCPVYRDEMERYLQVEQIAKGIFFGGWFYFTCSVPAPTQHERLEARLRLREWLRDKVPPDQIPRLLGEQ